MQLPEMLQPGGAPVGHVHPARAVAAVLGLGQVPCQGHCRSACTEDQRLRASLAPVVGGQKRLQRVPDGPWIRRPRMEPSVSLVNAAELAHRAGQRLEFIKLVPARGAQIDLMRGDKRAERQRIVSEVLDGLPVPGRLGVQREIHPAELTGAEAEMLSPTGKDFVDGRLCGHHADEKHRWLCAGCV